MPSSRDVLGKLDKNHTIGSSTPGSNGIRRRKKPRGASNLDGLTKKILESEELRTSLKCAQANVFLYDHNSPQLKRQRMVVRSEFIALMRAFAQDDAKIPPDADDGTILRLSLQSSNAVENACIYLQAIGSSKETNRGSIAKVFKIDTLRKKAAHMWWFAAWHLKNDAGYVYSDWSLRTEATMHKLATEIGFGTEIRPKEYFSAPELWLLLQTMFSSALDGSWWWKQNYALWALLAMTGARPGSIALNRAYVGLVQYLQWKDIRFFRLEDRPGLFIEITLRWLKGQHDGHNKRAKIFKSATFVFFPVRHRAHLCMDLTWILPQLALERGLFGDRTLESIENNSGFEIAQVKDISLQPVLYSRRKESLDSDTMEGQPLFSDAANLPLQRMARLSGISVRATLYCFRREFVTAIKISSTKELAKECASHAPDRSAFGRYNYGTGDMNMTDLRLGYTLYDNSKVARNSLREELHSPAIAKLNVPLNEDRLKSTVDDRINDDEDVIEFEDLLRVIITTFRERFGIAGISIKSVLHGLSSLSGGEGMSIDNEPDLASSVCPDDRSNPEAWRLRLVKMNTPAECHTFMKSFLFCRSHLRKFKRTEFERQYIEAWDKGRQVPSLEQVNQRRDLSRDPTILSASELTLSGRRKNPPAYTEAHRNIASGTDGMSIAVSEFIDISWDGGAMESLGGSTDELDVSPLEEDFFDGVEDGARIEVGTPEEVDEDDEAAVKFARHKLIAEWDGYQKADRSMSWCPLCVGRTWNDKSVGARVRSALDNHICAKIGPHATGSGRLSYVSLYVRWCRSSDGKFECRMCSKRNIYLTYVRGHDFIRHLKHEHSPAYDRLQF